MKDHLLYIAIALSCIVILWSSQPTKKYIKYYGVPINQNSQIFEITDQSSYQELCEIKNEIKQMSVDISPVISFETNDAIKVIHLMQDKMINQSKWVVDTIEVSHDKSCYKHSVSDIENKILHVTGVRSGKQLIAYLDHITQVYETTESKFPLKIVF